MVFLNPLYLFAMLLASIPALIHLFSRRRLEKIPFSSLDFLKAVEKTRVRWWRLREILLLILRTLAIVLLVLALARPVLKGISLPGLGIPPPTSLALIIDNSFSMGSRLEETEGTAFQTAKRKALELVDRLRTGDEVHLILSSDHPSSPLGEPTRDPVQLRREIERAELSFRPTDHLSSLLASRSYLEESKSLQRSVYLFTDLQRLGFESLFAESLPLDPRIGLYVVEAGRGPQPNVAVESVEVLEKLLIPQEVVELRVDVRNYGRDAERIPVSLWVDGVKKGQLEARLGPGGRVSLPFSYQIESLGDQTGCVEIEDPFLEPDNIRFFSFHIPERVDVLLVDGGDVSHPQSSESFYLERALRPERELLTPFRPEIVSWNELLRTNLRRYGVVALLNGRSFSREIGERLAKFVEQGGGLLVALGDRVEPSSYQDLLLRLTDMSLGELPRGKLDPAKFMTISQADYSSPILSPFKDPAKGDISLPRFHRVYPLKGGRRILARFSDLSPFLVEGGIGSGRAIVAAAPFNRAWSDLPIRAIYLPLVHRIFSYLAKEVGREWTALVGEEFSLQLKGNPRSLKLVKPDGGQVSLEPSVGMGSVSVNLTGLDSPGLCRVLGDGDEIESFSVNIDPRESDLSRIDEEELTKLIPQAKVVRETGSLSRVSTRAMGSELRAPFLALAFLLLTVEMAVGLRRT